MAGYIRGHWHIGLMHGVLDVAFREDENRTEAGHAGANLGMIRRAAISLLKRAGRKSLAAGTLAGQMKIMHVAHVMRRRTRHCIGK